MELKYPLAYSLEQMQYISPDHYTSKQQIFDNEISMNELVFVNSTKKQKHFRSKGGTQSPRSISGCKTEMTQEHINTQLLYQQIGFDLEVIIELPDGSHYVVDCYNKEDNQIAEVVNKHGDICKARVLWGLGFDVVWHFTKSSNEYNEEYNKYGMVINESQS